MTHASLFSGIGGFDLAAEWMGWHNAFHCEINEFCTKILNYHFPDAEHYTDITRTDFPNGEGESMYSPEGSLASPSVWPDKEKERMITVTSGLKCSGLYGKSGPLGSLVRMLLESSRWYSPARRLKWGGRPLYSERITEKEYCTDKNMLSKPFVETLNVKDTPSNRYLFRLVPLEHRTEGTEFGLLQDLLPTPTAIDAGTGRMNKSYLRMRKKGRLLQWLQRWDYYLLRWRPT